MIIIIHQLYGENTSIPVSGIGVGITCSIFFLVQGNLVVVGRIGLG
jgi:hypothetical protein